MLLALILMTASLVLASYGVAAVLGLFKTNYGQHAGAGVGALTTWQLVGRISGEYLDEWEAEQYGRHAIRLTTPPRVA